MIVELLVIAASASSTTLASSCREGLLIVE